MWYVIQVYSGREDKVCSLIRQAVGEAAEAGGPGEAAAGGARPVLKELFVPKYQVERKVHGRYQTQTRVLFPGYVIADTAQVGRLNLLLKRVPALTRLLGSEKSFLPLNREEQAFIRAFTKQGNRVVRVSRAVVEEGDRVRVLDGPMFGLEGMIVEIKRRKGTARIEYEAMGRTVRTEVGLAVMAKQETT